MPTKKILPTSYTFLQCWKMTRVHTDIQKIKNKNKTPNKQNSAYIKPSFSVYTE